MRRNNIIGIILAAGKSERMGMPKPLVKFEKSTFLDSAIASLKDLTQKIVIVLGYQANMLKKTIRTSRNIEVITNNQYEKGQLSSIKCALKHIKKEHWNGIILSLIDHPGISRKLVKKLILAFKKTNKIIIPVYKGRRGHPVIFPREFFNEILKLPVSKGANEILKKHNDKVYELNTNEPSILKNINTPIPSC